MTSSAMVFMAASWTFVLALTACSFRRILKND